MTGLGFWEDTPEEIKNLKASKISRLAYPQTGWRPVTEPPNIRHAKWIGLDLETKDLELNEHGPGWARGRGHIVGISVAVEGAKWYLPMRHEIEQENNLDPSQVLQWAAWALSGDGVKIGANLQYDIGWLKHEGVKVLGKTYDVQIAESLINETSELSLEELGWRYLGRGKTSDELKDWILESYGGPKTRWRKDIYRAPPSLVGPYAEDDADMPVAILRKQWPTLVRTGVMDVFEMECRLIRLLVDMRFQGVTIDMPTVEKLFKQFSEKAEEINRQACYIAGVSELNVDASASLAKAFDATGLQYPFTAPTDRNPNGQPSFTADFLKTVDHPLAKSVRSEREMRKLANTFLKSYLIDSNIGGKVYCSFHQTKTERGGTRTGRLASSDPNLQNIPVRTEEGKLIRSCFIMDHGHKQLRDFDYSQIEYRMLAHFATGAGSDELRARYNNDPNLDYHKLIGAMVKDIAGLDLARSYVKTVNFGIVYGVGIGHLAEMLGLDKEAAEDLLKKVHQAIPFAKSTMDDLSKEVNRTGIVKTILGRISHFDLWEPVDFKSRALPLPYEAARDRWGTAIMRAYLYRALNYRLQGSAAEIMKRGMDICYSNGVFDEIGVPRLQVHDELLWSEPHGIRDDAWTEMQHVFETCVPCSVPIRFEGGVGETWATAH